ncbi:MAG TPA: hypothetical protein VKZ53_19525 [Candidatus Angelobacter sp.]|nr:hypothetical protein [Candidatus Angelobacter sp.]
MTVTLNLTPEIEAGLWAQARAAGVTLEVYLQHLVEKDLSAKETPPPASEESGMVWENGLLVYRTGRPLPTYVIDGAINRRREERSRDI